MSKISLKNQNRFYKNILTSKIFPESYVKKIHTTALYNTKLSEAKNLKEGDLCLVAYSGLVCEE